MQNVAYVQHVGRVDGVVVEAFDIVDLMDSAQRTEIELDAINNDIFAVEALRRGKAG